MKKEQLQTIKAPSGVWGKIAIIGGGNLGTAIAEGLLKSKFCKATDIHVTKRNTATLKNLEAKGINNYFR